ncbi:MAG: YkgJ family cysteine cluster protein [Syntrophobacteraceae bacterium]|jgi:Fe-S-cluster containining protein
MTTKDSDRLSDLSINHPSDWDTEQFRANWYVFLESLIEEEATSLIPSRRIRYQIEQTTVFREVVSGWDEMSGSHRLDAWKRLLIAAEEACRTILPACVECGECCRMGSPVLHLEDLPLLKSGKIPWDQLITLRRGEPARSPFDGRPFVLPEERIKVREKEGVRECGFFNEETDQCSIYSERPLQCRAQACWDPIPARDTAELPFLLRKHIFEEIDLLLEIMAEHENRCGFSALSDAFEKLNRTNGENVQEVLGLLAFEEHFRQFVSEKFNIPAQNMELLFGRSFAEMTSLFGFRVAVEPDGTRCLVADKTGEQD